MLFFCPVEVPLEDNCISLTWLITYFGWKLYLPSSHVSCLQTQGKSSAGRPGFIQAVQGSFLGFGPQCCGMTPSGNHSLALCKLPCSTRIFDLLTHLWKAWVCAEKISLPVKLLADTTNFVGFGLEAAFLAPVHHAGVWGRSHPG